MADAFKITVNKMPRVVAEVDAASTKAVDESLEFGVEEVKRILTPGHGVDTGEMEAGINSRKTGKKAGEIVNPAFYGRFVEYGTTFMEAIPHMRPAARKMGEEFSKTLKSKLGSIR